MNRTVGIVVGMLIVLVLVLYNTTYTVNFHEVAVVTRFGKPAGVVRDPGLHLKAPFFVDQVTRLDTRQQLIESPLETVMTRDGQQVLVQAFMTWRIDTDPDATLRFFTSYASVDGAAKELETQLQGALRAIGGYAFADLVGQGSKLGEAESAILEDLKRTRLAGTMPVSVGISQVVLPNKTTVAVLRRMAAVQETLANLEEAKGASAAEALKSQAKSQADIIMNFADQWAARIEAKGNEEATRYYQEMRSEAELAIFLTWLDTLKASLSSNTTYITDTTRAPFHLIDLEAPVDAKGIPQPGRQPAKK
jgi:membrane protease subunit HflC